MKLQQQDGHCLLLWDICGKVCSHCVTWSPGSQPGSRERPTEASPLQLSFIPQHNVIHWRYICHTITFHRPYLCADHLKILYTIQPEALSEIISQVQCYFNNLTMWSVKWQLAFNLNKCGIMHSAKHPYDLQLCLNQSRLETLRSVHDLGITYTRSVNYQQHASFIISKCRRLIGFIMKNSSQQRLCSLFTKHVYHTLNMALLSSQMWIPHTTLIFHFHSNTLILVERGPTRYICDTQS